jgi:UPF0755 protein
LKNRLIIAALLLTALIVAGQLWFKEATSPASSDSKEQKIFVIKKGEGIRQIAERLKAEGLIRSPLAFYLVIRKGNLAKDIQAGDFKLSPSMSADEMALELTHGTIDIWITIPEGWRNGQIAMLLASELGIGEEEFLSLAREGYMFPDTYLAPKEASASAIVDILKRTFNQKVREDLKSEIDRSNLSLDKIVILASIVEREAKDDKDRPLIAGVLKNRLDIGMPLQADATLQYIKGYDERTGNWWTPVVSQDKEIDSRFNTYKYNGLPPAPISNPGLASIKAAANPSKTDYIYYLSEDNGTTHYAKTLQEHNANIRKYLR